jgi:hypothetical protein
MSPYPAIPGRLKDQLDRVTPSRDRDIEYHPCAVTLEDGTELERVYVVEAEPYLRVWGIRPEEDPGKQSVSIESVSAIRESPYRLPAKLADKVYAAGESGMGYCVFTVKFSGGRSQAYVTGNAIDFIDPPDGLAASAAKKIHPHRGKKGSPQPGPDYVWCLYQGVDADG